jgi:hypothetical protein
VIRDEKIVCEGSNIFGYGIFAGIGVSLNKKKDFILSL